MPCPREPFAVSSALPCRRRPGRARGRGPGPGSPRRQQHGMRGLCRIGLPGPCRLPHRQYRRGRAPETRRRNGQFYDWLTKKILSLVLMTDPRRQQRSSRRLSIDRSSASEPYSSKTLTPSRTGPRSHRLHAFTPPARRSATHYAKCMVCFWRPSGMPPSNSRPETDRRSFRWDRSRLAYRSSEPCRCSRDRLTNPHLDRMFCRPQAPDRAKPALRADLSISEPRPGTGGKTDSSSRFPKLQR